MEGRGPAMSRLPAPTGGPGAPGAALARRLRRARLRRAALPALPPHLRRRGLDLLPHLEPGVRVELGHALRHLSLLALLRRVTGLRWVPLDVRSDGDVRRAA